MECNEILAKVKESTSLVPTNYYHQWCPGSPNSGLLFYDSRCSIPGSTGVSNCDMMEHIPRSSSLSKRLWLPQRPGQGSPAGTTVRSRGLSDPDASSPVLDIEECENGAIGTGVENRPICSICLILCSSFHFIFTSYCGKQHCSHRTAYLDNMCCSLS